MTITKLYKTKCSAYRHDVQSFRYRLVTMAPDGCNLHIHVLPKDRIVIVIILMD